MASSPSRYYISVYLGRRERGVHCLDKVFRGLLFLPLLSSRLTAGAIQLGAQLDAQRLQSEFLAARERDHSDLLQNFQNLAQNDQKILEALQNDGQERRQLQELLVALTKACTCRRLPPQIVLTPSV